MIHLPRAFFLSLLFPALFPFLLLLSLRCVVLGPIRERFSDRRPFSSTLVLISRTRCDGSAACPRPPIPYSATDGAGSGRQSHCHARRRRIIPIHAALRPSRPPLVFHLSNH
ncbi:hypothetical protein K438DRAFT_1816264 [Mycena galopus ATCC 62051]|nr:hypothetical protein K438DRAFT_1816264 [Mycena galopus ATCC 62051]